MTQSLLRPVAADAFRLAMRHLAGTVSIVTVMGKDGQTGCTVSSMQPFALEPPSVLLVLNEGGTTAQALRETPVFAVSVLGEDQRHIAQVFSGFHGEYGEARFSKARWQHFTPQSPPFAEGCLVGLLCETDDIIERYGHILAIARVSAMYVSAKGQGPLLYHNGGYGHWAG